MKVLVTGSAGFIGSALSIRLLDRGDEVIGIDNHNDYYDPKIKDARLKELKNIKIMNIIKLILVIKKIWKTCLKIPVLKK